MHNYSSHLVIFLQVDSDVPQEVKIYPLYQIRVELMQIVNIYLHAPGDFCHSDKLLI